MNDPFAHDSGDWVLVRRRFCGRCANPWFVFGNEHNCDGPHDIWIWRAK